MSLTGRVAEAGGVGREEEDPSTKGFETLSVLLLMRGSGEESWGAVLSAMGTHEGSWVRVSTRHGTSNTCNHGWLPSTPLPRSQMSI